MSVVSFDEILNRHKYLYYYQLNAPYDILAWLDTIPLSLPVNNLESDFCDGTLVAEIISYFFPEYIDMEMFRIARNMSQRTKNWSVLNSNVFPKIGLHVPGTMVHDIINGNHRAVELFLIYLREKLEEHLIRTGRNSRLQWETWRSFNNERLPLPNILKPYSLRRRTRLPGYGRLKNPYAVGFEDFLRIKDEEIEVLRGKLKRCEASIRTKEKRIQELEEKIVKMKPKRPIA